MAIEASLFRGRHPLAFTIICLLIVSGCARVPPVGHDEPVTVERLVGKRLTDINNDVSWEFDESSVTIENEGRPLPDYLVEELLGSETKCSSFTADWQFDESTGVLTLTEIETDDQPFDGEVKLDIRPAGPIRVNLGTRQYNVRK